MPTRILTLSGGGIRGIFQAVFLREIASNLGGPLRDHFDLIAGTSTGAIIALGIALNVDLKDIVDLFESNGSKIFPPKQRLARQSLVSYGRRGSLYRKEPLRDLLEKVFTDANGMQMQLKDCVPPVLVPATTLNRYGIRAFTTLERCGEFSGQRDGELFAADVALASAAAPLFFPAHQPKGRTADQKIRVEERAYVDGGLWSNNPVLQAVMTARRYWGVSFEDMRVVSVGNGEVPSGELPISFDNMRRARMLAPAMDMMFATQSELADETVGTLLDDANFSGKRMLRINVQLGQPIGLDDVEAAIAKLKPLAEQEARLRIGRFRNLLG
ncbi:patatin-like phospholipase family protein [Bradyrhizobium diazoefficiens]|uniref:patatin-like phospholipase family protein n=1 Tax=Bradyrhizobium diazoefficiens TaxID=1355477 RepID=UPI0027146848|nr:patatin-like phospholipase family protein [Bradyrhizobium diazoefficiens]WLB38383.1 patatin-like phospholipase family protein [Bradyrhizobium diazoefficiens]